MEIPIEKFALYVGSLAAALYVGFTINGWRYTAKIKDIENEHSIVLEKAAMKSLNSYKFMELTKNEAIKNAEQRAAKNAAAAANALNAADKLRREISGVPDRIAAASRTAVNEYASTASELFGVCTAEYQRVAAAADGHANDAKAVIDAWPRNQ